MHFKTLAHINNVRFMIECKGRYFVLSTVTGESQEIEDPDSLYRQGYWAEYAGDAPDKLVALVQKVIQKYF